MSLGISRTNAACRTSIPTRSRLRRCAVVLTNIVAAAAALAAAASARAGDNNGNYHSDVARAGGTDVSVAKHFAVRTIEPNETTARRCAIAAVAALPVVELLVLVAAGAVMERRRKATCRSD